MAEENNIRKFTAVDIEKYWAGKLSAAEMYALEKAAIDDPFLADALEGYRETKNAGADLAALKARLEERTGSRTTVIPFQTKKYGWLKVAAAIIIIGGVGVFVQQLVSSSSEDSMALRKAEENKPAAATAPVKPDSAGETVANSVDTLTATTKVSENIKYKPAESVTQSLATKDTSKSENKPGAGVKKDDVNTDVAAANAPPIVTNTEGKESEQLKRAYRRDAVSEQARSASKKEIPDSGKYLQENYANAVNPQTRPAFNDADRFAGIALNNKFNYRVVDAQNNPVPFANVFNTRDNIGTYTDIGGRFNLVSSDSVLNVQIRSLGFVSNNYRLNSTKQAGYDLVLKEDTYTRQQITDQTNRKVVSSLARKDSAELEEPEVGWGFYNTYVANNIQIPNNVKGKNTLKDVELSFDIDKNGHPVNIKVTKSSQCKECDDEAIRILKEGPKWKKKGKKSKTTIAIAVDQK